MTTFLMKKIVTAVNTELLKKRNSYLLRTYGLSLEDYNRILAEQGGGCAVCGKTPEQEGRNLAVDHDHKTREVRGILCAYHNHRIVGRHTKDGDSPALLRRVADYLDRDYHSYYVPTKKKRRKRASKRTSKASKSKSP